MKRRSTGRKLRRVTILSLVLVLLLGVLMPVASAEWRATPTSNPFTDVQPRDWHHDTISWAWINGITTGTSATTFGPNNNVTRAQFATFIHRVAGRPHASPSAFADSGTIPGFATIAVGWASSSGVTTGFLNDNTYRPNSNITREQIATMLHRYAENIGADTTSPAQALDAFPDRARVSGWATAAMRWAVHHGIITGLNGNLAPQSNATRAQTVTMLKRVVDTFKISAVNLPDPPSGSRPPPTQVQPVTLHGGEWVVGEHIPAGRYTATPMLNGRNSGNFIVWGQRDGWRSLVANEILNSQWSTSGFIFGVPSVTLTLENGDEINLSGLGYVHFNPPATPPHNTLTTGSGWVVGQHIAAGRYTVSPTHDGESGNFIVRDSNGRLAVNTILRDTPLTTNFANGQTIFISGISSVTFTP
ncbi:MAG: S-layer homology domain-containing protein [Oscillospiraceae bacterium]|nr:S-layer homology domain-containing protein [Oscillospiraceae bacterium]